MPDLAGSVTSSPAVQQPAAVLPPAPVTAPAPAPLPAPVPGLVLGVPCFPLPAGLLAGTGAPTLLPMLWPAGYPAVAPAAAPTPAPAPAPAPMIPVTPAAATPLAGFDDLMPLEGGEAPPELTAALAEVLAGKRKRGPLGLALDANAVAHQWNSCGRWLAPR